MGRATRALDRTSSGGVRFGAMLATAMAVVVLASVAGLPATGPGNAGAAVRGATPTGFAPPFSGDPRYESLAPGEITDPGQLNAPIGLAAADTIAKGLGLRRSDAFTPSQFAEFISGGGTGGIRAAAAVFDESVRILTNTVGRPLYSEVNGVLTPSVLASYGLFVNKKGMLESPANKRAPTRQVNRLIAPGGYLGRWCRANSATKSLVALYRSAYTIEAAYGYASQKISGAAQLVANTQAGVTVEVGMSMAPTIWLVNFALIYILSPVLAADLPAYWAPIPGPVADALLASPTGQVPYAQFASEFP